MVTPRQVRAVFVAAMVVASMTAVVSVGAITALGQQDDGNQGEIGNIGIPGHSVSVDFIGCKKVRFIIPNENVLPLDVDIEILERDGDTRTETVTIGPDDLVSRAGLYDGTPFFEFKAQSGERILSVTVFDFTVDNPRRCRS